MRRKWTLCREEREGLNIGMTTETQEEQRIRVLKEAYERRRAAREKAEEVAELTRSE